MGDRRTYGVAIRPLPPREDTIPDFDLTEYVEPRGRNPYEPTWPTYNYYPSRCYWGLNSQDFGWYTTYRYCPHRLPWYSATSATQFPERKFTPSISYPRRRCHDYYDWTQGYERYISSYVVPKYKR